MADIAAAACFCGDYVLGSCRSSRDTQRLSQGLLIERPLTPQDYSQLCALIGDWLVR
jgi:hypothetical protein